MDVEPRYGRNAANPPSAGLKIKLGHFSISVFHRFSFSNLVIGAGGKTGLADPLSHGIYQKIMFKRITAASTMIPIVTGWQYHG